MDRLTGKVVLLLMGEKHELVSAGTDMLKTLLRIPYRKKASTENTE